MRAVMCRYRRPDVSHLSMWLDVRAAPLAKPARTEQSGRLAWWASLRLDGQRAAVPLVPGLHEKQ
jgi:putative transposase